MLRQTNGSSVSTLLPIQIVRMLHASHVSNEEARYLINGSEVTQSEIRSMHPTDRTVGHWSILVDWDLQRIRQFVVVDPLDPSGLLYLNQAEYLSQSKVCASNDLMLIVIARPGSSRPEPSSSSSPSQNSPWGVEIEQKWTRQSRLTWKSFLHLRDEVKRIVNAKKGSTMVSVSTKTVARTVYAWVRQLAHYAEVKNPGTYVQYFIPFVSHLQVLLENNGRMAAVKFLKISLFALYSYVSGNPLKATILLGHGIRLRNGLPAVWNKDLRDRIRRGDMSSIRLMASLLNLYRALDAPHPDFDVASIKAIAPDLGSNIIFGEYQKFCREVFPTLLRNETGGYKPFHYKSALGLLIRKAGPNLNGPSMAGITLDAQAWFMQPENHVLEWFRLHKDTNAVNLLHELRTDSHWDTEKFPVDRGSLRTFLWGSGAGRTPLKWDTSAACQSINDQLEGVKGPILGRLHAIEEPAGKVRIVAICDYFTQVALKPIHDHLFQILGLISSDATFDQTGKVEAYFQRGLSPHWSYDLKTATDSIPLALYRACLAPLLRAEGEAVQAGEERANLWAKVIADRDFLLPDASGLIRYGTGQPMGALSSWASLAIVHHSLVQFAAHRAAKGTTTWYQDYLVLGDDIDIARTKAVADCYREICANLSITIGLLKSLQSEKNCFEFANQRYCPGGNISPISIKEELSALTWTSRVEYAKRILARFGTSLKDGSSALLRKASTHAQWKVLGAELSGLRPSTLVEICKFCLLNPFHKVDELRIDSILNWLAPILPTEERAKLVTILESPTDLAQLEREVALELLDTLVDRCKTVMSQVPKPWEIKIPAGTYTEYSPSMKVETNLASADFQRACNECSNQFPEVGNPAHARRGAARSMRLKQLFSSTYYGGWVESIGKQGLSSQLYVMHCVNIHNGRVSRDLDEIFEKLTQAAKRFDNPLMPTMYDHTMMMTKAGPAYPHPFTQALGLWEEFGNIPAPVIPTPTAAWLRVEEDDSPLSVISRKPISLRAQALFENKVRGPITPVSLALAKITGITVPLFPYHVWSGRGHWTHALKARLASWVKTQDRLKTLAQRVKDGDVILLPAASP